jgi:Na+/H+ antiporter NhaC
VTGAGYVLASFLIACAVSTSTGTSLGTLMLCAPLLYPAGGALGAHPVYLIGAILGGATFGDNLSPISDTTIASTVTQGANMGKVVRSRLRYALPAAAMAMVAFAFLGKSGIPPEVEAAILETSPAGLPMLLAPGLVVWLLLRHVHLVEGLLLGILSAVLLGLALGRFALADLFFVDAERTGTGILVDGMMRGVGVSIFTLLLMGLVSGVESSGVMQRLLEGAGKRISSPRAAETWIFTTVSAATLVTTHSVVALLAVGRAARETGRKWGISAERRANILDVTVCTYPFLLPYCIPTVFAASTTNSGKGFGMPVLSAFPVGLANFHSWALLLVILVAIFTGWGRYTDEKRDETEDGDSETSARLSSATHRLDSREFGTFGFGELFPGSDAADGAGSSPRTSPQETEIIDRPEEPDLEP